MLTKGNAPASGQNGAPHDRKKVGPGLFFSALLIAMSFVTLIVPLAVYHVAQVAAAVKMKTGLLLLGLVILFCFFFGLLLGLEPLLSGGIIGAVWAPILAFGLFQRSRAKPLWPAALVFFIPFLVALFSILSAPQIPSFANWLQTRLEQHLDRTKASIPLSDEQALKRFALEEQAARGLLQGDAFQQAIKSRDFENLAKLLAFSRWERVAWLTFGEGGSLLLFLLAICIGNLLLLDVAFSQVERIKALKEYLLMRKDLFPHQVIENLHGLSGASLGINQGNGMGFRSDTKNASQSLSSHGKSRAITPMTQVVSHERSKPKRQESEKSSGWKNLFIREKRGKAEAYLWGYVFRFSPGPWELKHFSLPLPLVLFSVAFLSVLGFLVNDSAALIRAAGVGVFLNSFDFTPYLAFFAIFSFLCLVVIAFQGVAVLYLRLSPMMLLVLLLVFLVMGSYGGVQPLLVLSVLGGLGLLDYVYDFRGRITC